MRYFMLFIILLTLRGNSVAKENSKYFVFVGEKISLTRVPHRAGEKSFDSEFLARYRVIKPYRGNFKGKEIEFTVFDHYGTPPFTEYQHVLLYVEYHKGKYFHAKYIYNPLYKTKQGQWASPYNASDYNHEYNKNTTIKPEIIDFAEPVVIDVSKVTQANRKTWFPEPYYRINGGKATAVYGNYLRELFLLQQNGVLKARGDFQ